MSGSIEGSGNDCLIGNEVERNNKGFKNLSLKNDNENMLSTNLLLNNSLESAFSKPLEKLKSTTNLNNKMNKNNTSSEKTNQYSTSNDKPNQQASANYQSHHIHQYQKIQNYEDSMKFKLQITKEVAQLVREKDHNSLAYLARTCGIPPQLRHVVWPILLKYHPFVLCPNILTNTLQFSINENKLKDEHEKVNNNANHMDSEIITENIQYQDNNDKFEKHNIAWDYQPETKSEDEIVTRIKKDINKYIMVKHEDNELINIIKDCVIKFLNKWGKIFKYESGLTWVCLSLMEWCSPFAYDKESQSLNVLPGRSFYRSTHINSSSNSRSEGIDNTASDGVDVDPSKSEKSLDDLSRNLFLEYPLLKGLSDVFENEELNLLTTKTSFFELFEKTLLVFLHAPDLKTIIANKESKLSQDYSPVISGGDFNFNQNLFYKMFEDCFPDLYQPFIEQLSGVLNTSQTSWMYYWLKFASVRTFNKSDRARFWDLMFGWRANPINLDFFLKYKNDDLKINHFYKNDMPERWLSPENPGELSLKQQLDKYCNQNEDYFWFPDLNQMKFDKSTQDFYIFEELLKRNKQGDGTSSGSQTPETKILSDDCDANSKNSQLIETKKIENLNQSTHVYNHTKKSNNVFPYSLIDIHTQQILIYLTILQKNEFKLLEYEEQEVLEFLNNVPILSKTDDLMYKTLSNSLFETLPPVSNYEISDRESCHSGNSDVDIANLVRSNNRLETFISNESHINSFLTPVSSNMSSNNILMKIDSPKKERIKSDDLYDDMSTESSAYNIADDFNINNFSLTYKNIATQQSNINRLSSSSAPRKAAAPNQLSNLRNLNANDTNSIKTVRSATTSANTYGNLYNVEGKHEKTGSRKRIEFGTDDKTLYSFNEVLKGSGDIWRRWAYKELEQSNN
ncbi:hypothetical protein QEN19_003884 [Hanseniaspora menglaensis]